MAKQRPYLLQQPVVDGDIIPLHPGDAFVQGAFNWVEMVNGHIQQEGSLSVSLKMKVAKS